MDYDLEGRTLKFSKDVIVFLRQVRINDLNRNIISQLVRSATSVGANYCEANAASSKRDFRNKIFICKKEIQETKYWLELLAEAEPNYKENLRIIWKEAQELTLIFGKICSTIRN
jgi:four helix bundle protein